MRELADDVRQIPADFGVRYHRLDVVRVAWSGGLPSMGTATATATRVTNDHGGANVKVRQVSTREVANSGGLYQAGDMRVGPITPSYGTGGTTPATLQPAFVAGTEIYYVLQGDGFHAAGAWCLLVDSNQLQSFRHELVLRLTGAVPNVTLPT